MNDPNYDIPRWVGPAMIAVGAVATVWTVVMLCLTLAVLIVTVVGFFEGRFSMSDAIILEALRLADAMIAARAGGDV